MLRRLLILSLEMLYDFKKVSLLMLNKILIVRIYQNHSTKIK